MFSDSVKDAKKQSRKKVVGSKPKVEYYREIAKAVFDVEGEESIRSFFPWWDTLNGWWSEHPKYAFQMVSNSVSGVEKMVGNLEQAVSSPAELDKQVLDEEDENGLDSVRGTTSHPPSLSRSSPPLESPILFQPSPLPHIDPALLDMEPPLFCMDLPLPHVDPQLPDIKPGLDLEDPSMPSQSSSCTLARTPASIVAKSKGDPARQTSCTPGPKAQKDFMTDFHEATRIDQAQAQQEAQYHHVQQMA
ncbi:uncharacterized protein EI90DRAFT_3021365 [Cantharellus anzutake]|uniref:uncharacterized protein n=1 Tax=Cantharellus anzutake TaxID=1750568 RepID=UPI001905602C|nr:uncharacterized protein EI90DRAFT_3021365 [Cantharellus anzutake]KAF8317290.1 hypothetical protein EI90DRAFT_3021365 [Cantharellus anzutake]